MLSNGTLTAFGLYMMRTSAMVLASPALGSAHNFAASKVGLIAILSLVFYLATGFPLVENVGAVEFAALSMRELLIGFALAMVLQLALMVVRIAGDLIGNEMGLTMAGVADPVTGVSTPLVAQMYEGLFLIGLFAVDGHHVLLRGLFDSFDRAPVGQVELSAALGENIVRLFAEMFRAGLVFAAPTLVFLTLVSLLIGLIGRAVPQVHVMELGFSLRVLGALVAMVTFAPLLGPAMGRLYEQIQTATERVLMVIEG